MTIHVSKFPIQTPDKKNIAMPGMPGVTHLFDLFYKLSNISHSVSSSDCFINSLFLNVCICNDWNGDRSMIVIRSIQLLTVRSISGFYRLSGFVFIFIFKLILPASGENEFGTVR